MVLKQCYFDLKILLLVGGWILLDLFVYFIDKVNCDIFVVLMEEFLRMWKFYDGVDIDWEYLGGQGVNLNLGDLVVDGLVYVVLM